jgi:hypothetical protein
MHFVRDFVVTIVVVVCFITTVVWLLNKFLAEPARTQFRVECTAVNGKVVWNGRHMECWR